MEGQEERQVPLTSSGVDEEVLQEVQDVRRPEQVRQGDSQSRQEPLTRKSAESAQEEQRVSEVQRRQGWMQARQVEEPEWG